jgi:hypothetical protein
MARRRKRRTSGTAGTAGLGMIRVRGTLCRSRRGKFTKCRKPVKRGRGSGFGKRHADIAGRKTAGRCLKWGSGKTKRGFRRCAKRAPLRASGAGKGRCQKWSRGRTRCMKRA